MRKLVHAALDLCIFLAAATGTYFAHSLERPITAVLFFLTGVVVIAVHSGMTSALLAAIGASLVYNFLISGPAFEFGMASADNIVPLVAFNVCAVLTSILVGRLKDAASAARMAQNETAFLLAVSDRLQRAIRVEQIESEVREILPSQGVESIEIYLANGGELVRPSTGTIEAGPDTPETIGAKLETGSADSAVIELEGAKGTIGLVRFQLSESDRSAKSPLNLRSVSALLGLAVERCLLLEKLAEAEAAARSEELKDTILSSVSHDLRTPLTAIEAAASALASTEVTLANSDRTTLLHSIMEQCRRLDRYTTELLDVGQIHSGISKRDFDSVELAETVQLAINRAKLAHPSVRFTRRFPRKPLLVTANAAMLEQAIFNVMDNACKFGGAHGPVSAELHDSGDQSILSVTDLGPGVDPVDQPKLFNRFFKSERTRSRAGSGLGLFIARGFIEAFSGTISVQSPHQDGSGARFVITLPLDRSTSNIEVAA